MVEEILPPGQMIFVRTEGLLKKLSLRYSSRFKVVSVTKNNNYIVENALKETVTMSYPCQKLKVVADMESEDTKTREFDKILRHKTVNEQLVFEVLWKNSKSIDWFINFNNLEVINKYHQELEKGVCILKSSKRLRIKNSNINRIEILSASEISSKPKPIVKRGRGRSTKILKMNLSLFLNDVLGCRYWS